VDPDGALPSFIPGGSGVINREKRITTKPYPVQGMLAVKNVRAGSILLSHGDNKKDEEAPLFARYQHDSELEALLDLNGMTFIMDNGHWVKFEAWRIAPDETSPRGIRYSLMLHNEWNRRVLGLDNAHALKPQRKKPGGRIRAWDNRHSPAGTAPSHLNLRRSCWITSGRRLNCSDLEGREDDRQSNEDRDHVVR